MQRFQLRNSQSKQWNVNHNSWYQEKNTLYVAEFSPPALLSLVDCSHIRWIAWAGQVPNLGLIRLPGKLPTQRTTAVKPRRIAQTFDVFVPIHNPTRSSRTRRASKWRKSNILPRPISKLPQKCFSQLASVIHADHFFSSTLLRSQTFLNTFKSSTARIG